MGKSILFGNIMSKNLLHSQGVWLLNQICLECLKHPKLMHLKSPVVILCISTPYFPQVLKNLRTILIMYFESLMNRDNYCVSRSRRKIFKASFPLVTPLNATRYGSTPGHGPRRTNAAAAMYLKQRLCQRLQQNPPLKEQIHLKSFQSPCTGLGRA